MNNYKWIAFLEGLKLNLVGKLIKHHITTDQAAHVIGITIENTDNVGEQVKTYQVPVSEMIEPYVQFQLGTEPAPEWWANSATVPES